MAGPLGIERDRLLAAALTIAAVAAVYSGSAMLSVALIAQPEGVAMRWPAAGIAARLMLALGRGSPMAVAIGVLIDRRRQPAEWQWPGTRR